MKGNNMGYYERRENNAAKMEGWLAVMAVVTLAIVIIVTVAKLIRGWAV